jgi:alpha-tubulin suppressor-like RCC1 family protein
MDFEKTLSIKLRQYFNNEFKLLFISEYHIIIVTKVDKVYEFERNLKTLLEFYKNIDSFIESKIVNELCFKQIIDFKNSFFHVIARTIDGKVYCWGSNNCEGILGNGKDENIIHYERKLSSFLKMRRSFAFDCNYFFIYIEILNNFGIKLKRN